MYDNIDKEKLNKLVESFNENQNNSLGEKDQKEFSDKLKNIKEILIQDLINRKKFISLLSEKIQEEKDVFFMFEEEKIKNK